MIQGGACPWPVFDWSAALAALYSPLCNCQVVDPIILKGTARTLMIEVGVATKETTAKGTTAVAKMIFETETSSTPIEGLNCNIHVVTAIDDMLGLSAKRSFAALVEPISIFRP